MNIIPVFTNFVATETLRLDNDALERFCRSVRAGKDGRVISNGGGWQSDNLDLKAPELQGLLAEVANRLDELHRHFNFRPALRQAVAEAWININPRGGFNYSHNHPGSFISGVYYVKGGAAKGNIVFKTPIDAHAYTISDAMVTAHNAFTGHAMELAPATGLLVLFPSWLMHFVRPNETDEDRISIALNCLMLEKD